MKVFTRMEDLNNWISKKWKIKRERDKKMGNKSGEASRLQRAIKRMNKRANERKTLMFLVKCKNGNYMVVDRVPNNAEKIVYWSTEK